MIRFLLALSVSFLLWQSADAAQKPNVIYILADDLGYGDLSCYGRLRIGWGSRSNL